MATINCNNCAEPFHIKGSEVQPGEKKKQKSLCPRCKQQLLQKAPNRRSTIRCEQCSEEFETYPKLRLHRLKVHEKAEQLFYCDYCEKPFAKKKQMKIHRMAFHWRPTKSEISAAQEKKISDDMANMKL